MTKPNDQLEPIPTTDLAEVTGGNASAIGGQIGSLVDQFTGGSGRGAQLGSQIGGLVDSFLK